MQPIRLATEADAEAIAAIYAPIVRDTAISFELEPPDATVIRERIREVRRAFPYLVLEEGGRVLGYAYASTFRTRAAYRFSVETTVYVHEDARGRGVGKALCEDLIRRLIAQRFRRAIAGVTLPNAASVALHESLGFTKVGVFQKVGFKFGQWHDVGFWERELAPLESAPQGPLPAAGA